MSETKYRQVELRAVDAQARMVCWVDERPDLKVNAIVTLKEIPKVKWRIAYMYDVQSGSQRRTWRVGGVHDR